eukprot:9779134-Heterocapsa_arctica.AAC.1
MKRRRRSAIAAVGMLLIAAGLHARPVDPDCVCAVPIELDGPSPCNGSREGNAVDGSILHPAAPSCSWGLSEGH